MESPATPTPTSPAAPVALAPAPVTTSVTDSHGDDATTKPKNPKTPGAGPATTSSPDDASPTTSAPETVAASSPPATDTEPASIEPTAKDASAPKYEPIAFSFKPVTVTESPSASALLEDARRSRDAVAVRETAKKLADLLDRMAAPMDQYFELCAEFRRLDFSRADLLKETKKSLLVDIEAGKKFLSDLHPVLSGTGIYAEDFAKRLGGANERSNGGFEQLCRSYSDSLFQRGQELSAELLDLAERAEVRNSHGTGGKMDDCGEQGNCSTSVSVSDEGIADTTRSHCGRASVTEEDFLVAGALGSAGIFSDLYHFCWFLDALDLNVVVTAPNGEALHKHQAAALTFGSRREYLSLCHLEQSVIQKTVREFRSVVEDQTVRLVDRRTEEIRRHEQRKYDELSELIEHEASAASARALSAGDVEGDFRDEAERRAYPFIISVCRVSAYNHHLCFSPDVDMLSGAGRSATLVVAWGPSTTIARRCLDPAGSALGTGKFCNFRVGGRVRARLYLRFDSTDGAEGEIRATNICSRSGFRCRTCSMNLKVPSPGGERFVGLFSSSKILSAAPSADIPSLGARAREGSEGRRSSLGLFGTEKSGAGSSFLRSVSGGMQITVIFSGQKNADAFSDALAPFFDSVDGPFFGPVPVGPCRSISLFENDRLTPHIRWVTGNRVTPEKVGELVRRLDEDCPVKESEFIDSLGSGRVRMGRLTIVPYGADDLCDAEMSLVDVLKANPGCVDWEEEEGVGIPTMRFHALVLKRESRGRQ